MAFGFLKKAVRAARKGVGGAIKGVAKAGRTLGKELGKVPVVGSGLKGVYNLTLNAPFQVASDIAKGERLDRVGMKALKSQVANVKAVAPYAQTVIGLVPGIGQSINAGLGAGLALAGGQPLSKALLAGIKGALPGGMIAQAAFDVGQSAIEGKPITSIGLSALPIPTDQKKAIALGLDAAARIAKGERVDKAILVQAESAMLMLPPEARTGLNLGIAVAQGKNLQKIALKSIQPAALGALQKGGLNLIKASPVLASADKVLLHPEERAGFSMGVGMMAHKVRPFDAAAIRHKLTLQQRKGFDMAIATRSGMSKTKPSVTAKMHKTLSPAQALGFYTMAGLKGGTSNTKNLAKVVVNPISPTSVGAQLALKDIHTKDNGWWVRLRNYLLT